MKKKLTIILISLMLIIAIIFIDYSLAKSRKSKPLFSIKNYNSEKQMKTYTGLFYKIYTCTADDGIYEIKNIFSKVNSNFCPREYKIEFKNGYYTNNKNVKISEDDYNQLKNFYSIETIVNMDENDFEKSFDDIKKLKPITN